MWCHNNKFPVHCCKDKKKPKIFKEHILAELR